MSDLSMSDPAMSGPAMRILHYPTDVGGNPTGLARAERALGAESTVAVIERSPIGYEVDVDLDLGRRTRLGRLLGRAGFAARSVRRYDVLHFNFGQTMLPRLGSRGIDLPALRLAGKRLFMTFQGCDARLTGRCRLHCPISCCGQDVGEGLCRIEQDPAKRNAVAYAHRHCHRLFCLNPDLMHVVPSADFVPYAAVDPARVTSVEPAPRRRLRVLHAPTNRRVKGTGHVLEAAQRLAGEMDLVLVEGLPHAEAMRRYRDADLVVDQLKVGWYGALAVELMAMGKPVVCYIRAEDLDLVPPAMARTLPIVRAEPGSVTDVLAGLCHDRDRLEDIGARSRAFVERWHDPMWIARRLLTIYEDPTARFWPDDE